MHERYVNHRALVNDKRVARELILLVLSKTTVSPSSDIFAPSMRWMVEASMPHSSLMRFAARPVGGCKVCFKLKLIVHGKHGFGMVVFSRTGPPVMTSMRFWPPELSPRALHGGIFNAVCRFKAVDKRVNVHPAAVLCAAHGFDPVGGISLGLVKVRKIAGVKPCDGAADYLACLAKLIYRILSKVLCNAYQLRGCRRELSARNKAVAVAGIMHKLEHNGGAYAV